MIANKQIPDNIIVFIGILDKKSFIIKSVPFAVLKAQRAKMDSIPKICYIVFSSTSFHHPLVFTVRK